MDFESTKHFLKVEWQLIQIENRKFLFKSIFESNKYEILLFDLDAFKLFYLNNNESEIKNIFKVASLFYCEILFQSVQIF
jgi:hypothetical protein